MFSMLKTRKLALVAAVLALTTAASAAAAFFVIAPPPPFRPVVTGGKTYSTLAADWWKWTLSQSPSKSALLDLTGQNCGTGQSPFGGNNIWFLAGYDAGLTPVSSVTRNCTVPFGRTLVFPIINAAYGVFPEDPEEYQGEAFARSQVEYVKDVTDMYLTIDGQPVSNLSAYFERSDAFDFTLPANNIFTPAYGLGAQALAPWVDAGYYVVVTGLTLVPGKHVVKFGGNGIAVTYNLNVKYTPF